MSPMPTFAKKTTWTTPSVTNPTSRKGQKKRSSQKGSFVSTTLVAEDFGRGKSSNAVECTAEYDVNHQAPQTLRQPLPSGSKAGAMSRDLDM
ncbi:hypothetical protein E4U44_007735 [Claviceps purpurea]|nr:hypothetical protein E4U44_007735 [Claviceps purpurea]